MQENQTPRVFRVRWLFTRFSFRVFRYTFFFTRFSLHAFLYTLFFTRCSLHVARGRSRGGGPRGAGSAPLDRPPAAVLWIIETALGRVVCLAFYPGLGSWQGRG